MNPKRKSDPKGAAGVLGRPLLLAIVVGGVIALVLWQMNMPPQGTDVPGVAEGQVEPVGEGFDPSETIEGSADATDPATVEGPDAPDMPEAVEAPPTPGAADVRQDDGTGQGG